VTKLGPSEARSSHSPSALDQDSSALSSCRNVDPHHHNSHHLLLMNPLPLHLVIEELGIGLRTQHSHSGIQNLPS
jgi:hypothetical protein